MDREATLALARSHALLGNVGTDSAVLRFAEELRSIERAAVLAEINRLVDKFEEEHHD